MDSIPPEAGSAQRRLEAAIARDDIDALEAALKAGADPNVADDAGRSPLVQICGRPGAAARRAARALFDAGAEVSAVDRRSGWTVLHHAVVGACDAELVERLVERGADPDARSAWGESPLQRALRDRLVEKALVLARASKAPPDVPNAAGDSALALARDLHERVAEIVGALNAIPRSK